MQFHFKNEKYLLLIATNVGKSHNGSIQPRYDSVYDLLNYYFLSENNGYISDMIPSDWQYNHQ